MSADNLPEVFSFDEESWQQLPDFLGHLPQPVCLHVWGDEAASGFEQEAVRLARVLAERFPLISYRVLPRRVNYPYYPVIGIMQGTELESIDLGVRIIGLPVGYQMTSLIAGIQAVAFQGQTLEPKTRILLYKLSAPEKPVIVELLTSAEDMSGSLAAKYIFGMAVTAAWIKAYLIVTDLFPEAAMRYSATYLPYLVINQRHHFDGEITEEKLVELITRAIQEAPDRHAPGSQNHS